MTVLELVAVSSDFNFLLVSRANNLQSVAESFISKQDIARWNPQPVVTELCKRNIEFFKPYTPAHAQYLNTHYVSNTIYIKFESK